MPLTPVFSCFPLVLGRSFLPAIFRLPVYQLAASPPWMTTGSRGGSSIWMSSRIPQARASGSANS